MDPDKLSKLFDITERKSEVGTARETGTGLGLILCKELTDNNNGSIDVKSEPGKGSTFIVTLPLKKPGNY